MRCALAVTAALCGGCTLTGTINALVPKSDFRLQSTDYAAAPRHALDVYVPTKPADGPAPVVIFYYGGNWDSGDRANYLFAGEALASRGFVAVLPDYRLYPEVRFPSFLNDSAEAVRWTFDHITEYGGDPQRVFLMGHSAGAYNAAMLALNPEYLCAAGVNPARIRGFVGLAGPYDFLPLQSKVTKAIFGFPDTPRTTQPIHYASAAAPPMLLLTGSDDSIVDPGNSRRLADSLRPRGVPVREIVYPGLGHLSLAGALAKPLRWIAPVLDDVTAFITEISHDPGDRPARTKSACAVGASS